jgi:autotransporter-associated beta strand protein
MKHTADFNVSPTNEKSTRMNMKNPIRHTSAWLCALLTTLGLATAQAQMTANWTAGAGTTDWNTALNWDIGVPAEGTNASVPAGNIVDYTAPMTATSFAGLNNSGTVNVGAAGFNIDAAGLAAYTANSGSMLQINAGGVMTATNSVAISMANTTEIDVENGGFLAITNSTGTFGFGPNGNQNPGAGLTNNGGTIIFSQPFASRGRFTHFATTGGSVTFAPTGTNGIFETSNDQERPFLINGGTVNLGNFTIGRTLNTVGSAGLVISNGVVNATTLIVGNGIAAGGATIAGGVLTNTGPFIISDRSNAATSGQRRIIFYMRGGSVYSTDPNGIIMANQANNSATGGSSVWGAFLDMNAGLLSAEKLTLVGPNATSNAFATVTLSGSGSIYLGSGGLVGNVGVSGTGYTVSLNGGTLGALADYSINANGTLGGNFTVNAADTANVPHNITLSAVWSGSGSLTKIGNGSLILNSNNTFSGATLIGAGSLVLGASGSISNTPTITIASGASLDATAVVGGFPLASTRTLQGFGSALGTVAAASGSIINPGSNTVTGTLTLGSLTETGGAINKFDLSTDPAGPNNDLLTVTGDLNASGINTMQISGGGGVGTVFPLIHYGGTFNGTVDNFTLFGASGVLSNNATTKTIYLVIQSTVRPPTGNVVWQGNSTVNDWDLLVHANWLTNGVATYFVSGDGAVFNDVGAANTNVNIPGIVDPASMLVDSTAHYTWSGAGSISGSGTGLTKTNSGTLTILTTNSFSGPTLISGGTLEVSSLANGGTSSGIGASPSATANLVLDSGTLNYLGGNTTSDHGVTLNTGNGTIGVTDGAASLSLGTVVGPGALTKTGPGTLILTAANSYTNGTVISNGVLQFNSATGPGIGGVTNNGGTVRFSGAIIVDNPLNFNGATRLEFTGVGSGNVALRGSISGSGNIDVNLLTQNASQTLSLGGEGADGGSMSNFFGTINFGTNIGFVRFNNNESHNFGSSNATFNLGTGSVLLSQRNGNTINYLGGLAGGPNTKLSGSRSDTPGPETYIIGGNNQSTEFDGIITNGTAGSSTTIIIKDGTGTLALGGTNVYTGDTDITNGVLALVGNGVISNSLNIGLFTNTIIDSSARVDGTMTLFSGQTLRGSGTIRGSLAVGSGANLFVGDTDALPEAMTITNALVLQTDGVLNMDLDHHQFTGGLTNDVITGLNSVTYGGTLNLNIISIETNSVFKLFNAAHYSGAFASIQPPLPPLSPNIYAWDRSHLAIDGTLRITLIHPAISSVDFSGLSTGSITINATGLPNGPVTILSSTNLSTPLANWTPAATGNFDGNGNFVSSITVDPSTAPTQFFTISAQQ